MNIDYDKACSMIKTYFGLKIHKESLMKLLPYCKKIEFQKSEIILEIGEKMKIFVAMQWPDTPGPYYLFAGKCATIYKI